MVTSPTSYGPRSRDAVALRIYSDRLAGQVIYDRLHSTVAVNKLREHAPGWTTAEYGSAIEDAIAQFETHHAREIQQRAAVVTAARETNLLNGVFLLFLHNYRGANPVGLDRIDILEALGDMYSVADLEAAIARSRALMRDGSTFQFGREPGGAGVEWRAFGSKENQRPLALTQEMRRRHPGFSEESIGKAIDYGFFINR